MTAHAAIAASVASAAHTARRAPPGGAPHPWVKGTSRAGGRSGREMAPGFGICERQKSRFVSFCRVCLLPVKTKNP